MTASPRLVEALTQRLGQQRVMVLASGQRGRLAEKLAEEDCDLVALGLLAAWFEDEASRKGPHAPDWRGGYVDLLRKPNAIWREVVSTLELNPQAGGKSERAYRGDAGAAGGGGSASCRHGRGAGEHCDACDPLTDPAIDLDALRTVVAEKQANAKPHVIVSPTTAAPGEKTRSGMSFGRFAKECAEIHPERCRSGVYQNTKCVTMEEWAEIQAGQAAEGSEADAPKGDGWAELTEGVF